jgi:hypothetical protein
MKSPACVITAHNGQYKEITNISSSSIKRFCDFNGYDWTDRLIDKPIRGLLKVEAILDGFKNGHEYIIWLDSDIIISNYKENIILDCNKERDLYMCWHEFKDEILPSHYNSGVMVIRNCQWSREFFQEVQELGEAKTIKHVWTDQAVMLHLLGYDNLIQFQARKEDKNNKNRDHVGRLSWNWNSIVGLCVGDNPHIHHFAGVNMKHRTEFMRLYAKNVDYLAEISGRTKVKYLQALDELRPVLDITAHLSLQNQKLLADFRKLSSDSRSLVSQIQQLTVQNQTINFARDMIQSQNQQLATENKLLKSQLEDLRRRLKS